MVAQGQALTAMWDPNSPADDVSGYEVCIGTASASCNSQRATVSATENSYTFSVQPGVLYYVAVRAVNGGGASPFSAEIRVSIPSLAQPPSQTSTANVPISALALTASDPDGGTLQFSHSGLPFGVSLNSSTGIITGTPTTAGTYTVTVFVTDGLETTSRSFGWTVQAGSTPDSTAPTLAITSHSAGQMVTTASITLSGSASDSGSGGSGISSVTVNGAAATNGSATGSNTANWSRSVTLTTGSNVLTVVATDGASNTRTSQITINRASADATAPTLAIASHSNGQTVTTSSITLTGTATDNGAGGSGITSVTINGAAATGGTATGNNTANWSRSLALATGANVLTVIATDGANNARTSQITINRASADTTAPALVITSHNMGQAVTTPNVTLAGTATDNGAGGSGIASVTVNGTSASGGTATGNNTSNWSRALTLTPGANTLTVVATDTANNSRTSQITITYTAPLSLTLTSDRLSPQATGTPVVFSAGASNGAAPYQFKWWLFDGTTWTMLQDWSAATTYTWTPTAASSNYRIGIWARDAKTTADINTFNLSMPYVVNAASTSSGGASTSTLLTISGLTPSLASPRSAGTSITFTASATGGTGQYQFKWWIFDGNTWTMAQNWGSATYTWTPTTANANYRVGVWARDATVTADISMFNQSVAYPITSPAASSPGPSPAPTPVTITGLIPNVPSPRVAGTSITFTASASGGTGSYQFKWWLFNGTTWTMVQNWGGATYTWTPTLASGSYRIGIWARDATNTTEDSSVNVSIPFAITSGSAPAGPFTITGLTPNMSGPRPAGTSITFTASASGGSGIYQFKWWVFNGTAWTLMQDWGGATYMWTPTLANANYRVGIWARDATTTADVGTFNLSIPFAIVP